MFCVFIYNLLELRLIILPEHLYIRKSNISKSLLELKQEIIYFLGTNYKIEIILCSENNQVILITSVL